MFPFCVQNKCPAWIRRDSERERDNNAGEIFLILFFRCVFFAQWAQVGGRKRGAEWMTKRKKMFRQVDKVSSPNCVCYFESILIVAIPLHYTAPVCSCKAQPHTNGPKSVCISFFLYLSPSPSPSRSSSSCVII